MFSSLRKKLLLAVVIGLCTAAISGAVPSPKDKDSGTQPKSFGVLVNAAQCPRPDDAVDVYVEEVGADGSTHVIQILSRVPVVVVEDVNSPRTKQQRCLVLLEVQPSQSELLHAASKRGPFSLSPHYPSRFDEFAIPLAGQFAPIWLGD